MVAHSEVLLSKCAQFRDEGQFIDVRLKVREDIFPAHRIVLAANSDYFHAMFIDGMKESNQEVIELKDESISPDALKIVMDSIYTGDLRVNKENVFEVLAAADHLQVTTVVELCCDFLKRQFIQVRLDLNNYCLLSTVADKHGLRDLQEAAEKKIASMYVDVCESEEFLSNVGGDQLFSLLSRDDLSAPSETFVFKSVIQWIKHKKEERMAVAAKVIGAVRLGLVDIKTVIEELSTEEMKRVPEIYMQLYETSIHNNMPSHNSKFAMEKANPRSMKPVLVAISSQRQMQYFDVETTNWKPFPSTPHVSDGTQAYYSAIHVDNCLYLAAQNKSFQNVIYRYDLVNTSWETLPPFLGSKHDQIKCLCVGEQCIFAFSDSDLPQRYNLLKNNWQSAANLSFYSTSDSKKDKLQNVAAVVFKSKIYVIHGYTRSEHDNGNYTYRVDMAAVVHCFDPAKNKWEQKSSTRYPHFGSSLFVVDNRLCVAGGKMSTRNENPAPVEVYSEENNAWSVEEQNHIPPNNLGAVEIKGRVYFIINKFPIDSGIRIPPEEAYDVSLNEWENVAKIGSDTVLCYLPLKRENLRAEQSKSLSN